MGGISLKSHVQASSQTPGVLESQITCEGFQPTHGVLRMYVDIHPTARGIANERAATDAAALPHRLMASSQESAPMASSQEGEMIKDSHAAGILKRYVRTFIFPTCGKFLLKRERLGRLNWTKPTFELKYTYVPT